MTGQRIAHYELVEKIGEGGMGIVYKARDTHLDRFVALKVLPPHVTADPGRRQRFVQEAKSASALNHSNIITIHDISNENGTDFIVMEYVSGEPLDQRLARGPLGLSEALKYALQIADALVKAHEAGIVHRDLKPGNIMVGEGGRVKVLDFGLAKLTAPVSAVGFSDASTAMGAPRTEQGTLIGTAAYMSPEQAKGESVDARSDIFSFGLVLYEMVTGRRPFQKDTSLSTLVAVLTQEPVPLRELASDVPPELDRIISACLRKDPGQRHRSMAEVKLGLEKILTLRAPASKPAMASIAVLPFANLSPEKDNEYFSDGLSEEIISSLNKIPGLRVTARTSSFSLRGKGLDVREMGERLGVETILGGSVRRAGNRLRVLAELVNVADGCQLWSERFDRIMEDVFDIQDEISQAIVGALKARLAGAGEKPVEELQMPRPMARPVNMQAHSNYLRGRFYWNRRTWEALRRGIEFFNQAIEQDPAYALAYVGLADSYNLLGYYNERAPRDAYSKAKAAASQALQINETIAEAHASLGYARVFYDWDWPEAEKEFQRAIELSPSYASAHQWYAWYFFALGKFDDAVQSLQRALELDPLSPIINAHLGLGLSYARREDMAIAHLKQLQEMDSNFPPAYTILGTVYLGTNRTAEAIEQFRKAVELSEGRFGLARLGHAYGVAGNEHEARAVQSRMEEESKRRYISPLEMALVHAGLSQNDEAFRCLDRACEDRTSDLIRFKVYPWSEAFRSDPRYHEIVKRIGLPVD